MNHSDIKALENAGRSAMVWTEGYDGQTHYRDVLRALAPAAFILLVTAGLLLAVL